VTDDNTPRDDEFNNDETDAPETQPSQSTQSIDNEGWITVETGEVDPEEPDIKPTDSLDAPESHAAETVMSKKLSDTTPEHDTPEQGPDTAETIVNMKQMSDDLEETHEDSEEVESESDEEDGEAKVKADTVIEVRPKRTLEDPKEPSQDQIDTEPEPQPALSAAEPSDTAIPRDTDPINPANIEAAEQAEGALSSEDDDQKRRRFVIGGVAIGLIVLGCLCLAAVAAVVILSPDSLPSF